MREDEIAALCARGDNGARRELYERYAAQLMGVCLRYVAQREAAEDVLHDAFLQVFRSIGQFTYRGEGSLRAWLTRVTVNESLGYLRRMKAEALCEVPMEVLPDRADEEADEAFEEVPVGVLMDLVRALPDGYRTIFNLYVFEDKSHKEIARLLGITEHTSSSQYYRAKQFLIKQIKQYKGR